MKTINGVPQFEYSEDGLIIPPYLNQQLREWASNRTCVKCYNFIKVGKHCRHIGFDFIADNDPIDPETFSCAAFSAKDEGGSMRTKED